MPGRQSTAECMMLDFTYFEKDMLGGDMMGGDMMGGDMMGE